MRVKMTKTTMGSENGYQVNSYMEGEVYNVSDEALAKHFVDSKVAEEVGDDVEPTKRVVEGAEVPSRGALAQSALEKIQEDLEAGIARPETDRLVELSTDNQVDVESEKLKVAKDKKRLDVERQKEELDATLNEPMDEKALKSADYENKSMGNKKGK